MATQSSSSSAPPNPTNGNSQNPVTTAPESAQPMPSDQQDANKGPTMETSMFVNKEPIREEQVQNAVKFLSHPKVKGSPVMYRRSFLERKGLTKEEIDEAFLRVPDQSPSVTGTQPPVTNQGGQVQPATNIQQQAPTQYVQPTAAAPAAANSKLGTLTASRFHWSHALLAVGVLAISGAGTAIIFKNSIVPRIKSWIRKVVLEDEEEHLSKKTNGKPSLAEEAATAAKAAAAAASDVARASQEMLISKTEEKRYFGELMNLLDMQVQEMRSMSNSIRKLEGQTKVPGQEDNRVAVTSSRPSYANGKADYDSHSVRSLSPPPASAEPSAAPPHPKSYMEIMAMVQRGERPPNIREINDLPPNPDQPVSNPRLAPRPKPWEAAQSQISSTYPQETSNGLNSYVHENGSGPMYQSNGDGSMPWWQQKSVRITDVQQPNEENKTGGATERPIQRTQSWVPPQPPPVAMAEAAAAIRQPKKLPFQKEQPLTDDQFMARSGEVVTDELQRITKISESGGVPDDSNMMNNTSEIQREDDNNNNNNYIEA